MSARALTSLVFLLGLGLLLAALLHGLPFGGAPMQVGQAMVAQAPGRIGTANIVTSIVLGYRGFDTMGEVTILFVAATAAGMVLKGAARGEAQDQPAGFILRAAAYLLFPFLVMLGVYIVLHGHLTPGGGFQGGAILAAAFFVPILANPASPVNERAAIFIEGLAGAAFIVIGLAALLENQAFLTPLLGKGTLGALASGGSLPLLYCAIGLKVGAELAGLMGGVAGSGKGGR